MVQAKSQSEYCNFVTQYSIGLNFSAKYGPVETKDKLIQLKYALLGKNECLVISRYLDLITVISSRGHDYKTQFDNQV